MIEKHINKVNVNPFFCSLIFQAFYNGYETKKCSILLHYLVLPFVMYSDIREIFSSITIRNNLENVVKSNKVAFADLQERVWTMKKLTDLTLINLHTQQKITLKVNIEIHESIDYEFYNADIKQYLRSASYVGKLFKGEDKTDIFKHLKVIL